MTSNVGDIPAKLRLILNNVVSTPDQKFNAVIKVINEVGLSVLDIAAMIYDTPLKEAGLEITGIDKQALDRLRSMLKDQET